MPQLLPEGTVVGGRYVLEAPLGDGAMGVVYRAHHAKVSRQFAIKILHPSLMTEPKVLQRFDREAELAGRLRHTNVVSVVDVGLVDNGLRYLAMELAPGVTLASILDDGALSESRMLDLTKQLCAGLAHAHDSGVIHRDFKPENVLVEQQAGGREVARIVDFGVAIVREHDESTRLTTKGLVIGTPQYMAPEQACAEPIDQRVDIFALGLICYEMLTGRLPFDGTGAEVAQANVCEPIPPMAVRAPHARVDPALEAIVMRMLAKNRDDRPENAHVVRALLEAYERRVVAPPAVTEKIVRVRKTQPWWLAVPLCGLVALLMPSHEVASAPMLDVPSFDETSTEINHRTHDDAPPAIMQLRPAAPPPAIAPTTAAELAKLYATVGRELITYERDHGMEATIDLWPRYRWIRINEAIATPEKRNETFKLLSRLRGDLNSRR